MNRVIKVRREERRSDEELKKTLLAIARGELTWAEAAGMSFGEAKAIARVGCDLAAAGRNDEARIVFEGIVAMNPRDAASRAALGTVYQKLGRIEDALAQYSAAIKDDPASPIALGNRGELRLKLGDRAGLNDLSQAVEADPCGETSAGRRAKGLVRAITTIAAKAAGQDTPTKPAGSR